jgi:hypothetical protein
MPDFTMYGVSVDVDVDIDIEEYVDACSEKEIKDLIKYLIDQEHLTNTSIVTPTKLTYEEEQFYKMLNKLALSYLSISPEDLDVLENLTNKY